MSNQIEQKEWKP